MRCVTDEKQSISRNRQQRGVTGLLNGHMLKQGIVSASARLGSRKDEVDALNVFPVPDGDTGTNMSATISAAAREIAKIDNNCSFSQAADQIASSMLRAARGNSGVILSLIFRGFAKSVKGLPHIGGKELARALAQGSEAAYKAVMKPTEGTMLTVIREAAQQAQAQSSASAVDVFRAALDRARESLARTPAMLPVLRQAGVVDAGGQGLVYIMEGLLHGFTGERVEEASYRAQAVEAAAPQVSVDSAYDYCTEFLIERVANAECRDTEHLRCTLAELGDCVVVVDDDEVIKVHVHSNRPGDVLNLAQGYGRFVDMKIENMRIQEAGFRAAEATLEPPEPEKAFGIVAVANGEGIVKLHQEIGVEQVVSGGQSMNPSTEDILKAVNLVPAEHVFVLPNNKNIIMAAEQAAKLSSRNVSVLQTRSVAQGVAAALEFDPEADAETNHEQMQQAAQRVHTGLVTYAARESCVGGLDIHKDAIIGLENGKLTVTEEDPIAAACKVAQNLVDEHDGTMVTIYAGEDITQAQCDQLTDKLGAHYNGEVDVMAVNGGQPMYYFIIAVE